MYSGYPNDVNNSISFYDVYNPGGTIMPDNVGVPVGNNQVTLGNTYPGGGAVGTAAAAGAGQASAVAAAPTGGVLGKPLTWWFSLLIVFVVLVVIARRYGGEERFTNIRASLYNLTFLVLFFVVIKNVLNVFAANFKVPGLSSLILAA